MTKIEAPQCNAHHPEITFVPLVGIGHDGEFGVCGFKCPIMCEQIRDDIRAQYLRDYGSKLYLEALEFDDPDCPYSRVNLIKTIQFKKADAEQRRGDNALL